MFDEKKYLRDFLTFTNPQKKDWVDVRDSMVVHTRGVLPTKLLSKRRPNEPEDVYQYRLDNYRPVTKDGINNAIDALYRTFTSANYIVNPADNIAEYIRDKRFTFIDDTIKEPLKFKEVFLEYILRLMIDDPNGYIVWLPINPVDPKEPPDKIAPQQSVEIEPLYVASDKVYYSSEDVFTFEAGKWDVKISIPGQNYERTEKHPFYIVCTKMNIWRQIPYYDQEKKKIEYRPELWYICGTEGNEFEVLPCKVFGGDVAINKEGIKYFESFMRGYVPFADECIVTFNEDQAVGVRYRFPFVSFKGVKCIECKGARRVKNEKGESVPCTLCNASGYNIPTSPYGQYIRKEPANGENEAFALSPAVEFYSNDVGILNHSFEVWQKYLELAKEAVNQIFTKESQSGVAKEIDREGRHEMLLKISQNFFDIIRMSLFIIEQYKVPLRSERKGSEVVPPTSFTVKSQDELYAELTDLVAKEAPMPFIHNVTQQLAGKVFGDEKSKRIVDLLVMIDPLYGKTSDQINTLKAMGAIDAGDIIEHLEAYGVLVKISEMKGFMTMTVDEVRKLAEGMFTEVEEEMPIVETITNDTPEDTQPVG